MNCFFPELQHCNAIRSKTLSGRNVGNIEQGEIYLYSAGDTFITATIEMYPDVNTLADESHL